jgi:type IV pilus assembly protein PilA
MRLAGASRRFNLRFSVSVTLGCAMLFSVAGHSQVKARAKTQSASTDDLGKNSALIHEFGELFLKVQREVQGPPLRSQSRLLSLLPESTLYYAAFPNYGNAAHQALDIFHQELQSSAVLRKWWAEGEMAKQGPELEQAAEKIYQVGEFVGDEIVVSGGLGIPGRGLLLIAEVRKPGLKEYLEQNLKQISGDAKTQVRVFDPQSLTAAKDIPLSSGLSVLVRPDFVVAGISVDGLRSFNRLLDEKGKSFAATPFGQRMAQGYTGGASVLAGADLQGLLKEVPAGTADQQQLLARTGFADVKYLVWEHKDVAGQASSEAELTFNGPRRGVASWIAEPAPLHSLEFVARNAVIVSAVRLKNFADIFDDVKELAAAQKPNPLDSIAQMEQAMNINLAELLQHFDGEITFAMGDMQTDPAWTAIARVNDAEGLQRTLNKLLTAMSVRPEIVEENGVRYYSLRIPTPQKPVDITFTFAAGYLLIGSSEKVVLEAVQRHEGGESMANSQKLSASLPSGHPNGLSGLLYEDPTAVAAMGMRQAAARGLASGLFGMRGEGTPIVICVYGEPSALREASLNRGADAGAIMMMAAIAIPNLLRARVAANEASAAVNLRTMNVAEMSYAMAYPQKGFARDLAALGPDPRGSSMASWRHAGLLDEKLASPSCTANQWCKNSGYSFTIQGTCGATKCTNYVAIATPLSASSGTRNLCSTSDGVIRAKAGAPVVTPLNVAQCSAWEPLH